MNNWLDLSDNANTFLSTIVDGFVDTSGGNIIVREDQKVEISGDASFNQGGSFAFPTLKTNVIDTTGLVELETSKIEFVENPSFIQYAYDITGAESGGMAGQSISKNLAGDIIAVGAPLNSGGGTARGEVRVYQKDNDSWLQLGNDLNGAADNDEFGHSLDLNSDGTILAVGTKDLYHNTLVYKYDSGSWGLYGNSIYQHVDSMVPAPHISQVLGDINKCSFYVDFRKDGYSSSITSMIGNKTITNTSSSFTYSTSDGLYAPNSGSWPTVSTTNFTFDNIASNSIEIYADIPSTLSYDGHSLVYLYTDSNNYYTISLSGHATNIFISHYVNGSDNFQYYTDSNSILSYKGTRVHVIVTLGSSPTISINNSSLNVTTQGTYYSSHSQSITYNYLAFGTWTDSDSNYGEHICYVRFFNDTLTSEEKTTLYNNRNTIDYIVNDTTITTPYNAISASTKPKLNKTGDKLTIISEQHFDDLSGNGQVQSYQYSESDASWNYLGDKIESASVNDISGGDIAINDEGNMIAIGYPQSKSSIQGTYSYSVINGSGVYEIYGEEFSSDTANPVLTFKRGSTYNLSINSTSSHPFWIQTTDSGNYDSSNVYNNGITNNGVYNDTLTFVVPSDAPDTLYYVCQYHGGMGNSISIVNESGNDGRTKVFKYNTTDSSWNQVGNNIDGEGQAGTAVVMDGSGDFVAIGSPNVNAGEVNVYQNIADTWTLYGNKIEGQADNDQFGTSLDMTPAGNILAVGAVNANGGKGNVNIYEYDATDSSWNKINVDLSGDAVGDLTGTSVKLNQLGSEVSVGEPNSNVSLAHVDAVLYWNFAQDITATTIGGDIGPAAIFRGIVSGVGDDEVITATLTESEGLQTSRDRSDELRAVTKSYVFPSDTFTIELYHKITQDRGNNTFLEYAPNGTSDAAGNLGRIWFYRGGAPTDIRIRLFGSTSGYSQRIYTGNGDFQDNTWHHLVFVCDMANASGPLITMYENGSYVDDNTHTAGHWDREPGFDRELGVSNAYRVSGNECDLNTKQLQVIDGLLDATEVAALYTKTTGGVAKGKGGSRTFEIEHTKFYNGMTNPTFGIGVTNPTNRLDVDGTVYIDGKLKTTNLSQTSGTTTVSGDLTLNGSISVDAVNNSSLTYDTDMSVNLLKRLFVNPNDISSYGAIYDTITYFTTPGDEYSWSQMGDDFFDNDNVFMSYDGTTVGVSNRTYSGTYTSEGLTRIFEWDGNDWQQKGQDIHGIAIYNYGIGSYASISQDNNRITFGTAQSIGGSQSGGFHVYDYENSQWVNNHTYLSGTDADYGMIVGVRMSLDGNTITNEYGDGYIVIWKYSNSTWSTFQTINYGSGLLNNSTSCNMSYDGSIMKFQYGSTGVSHKIYAFDTGSNTYIERDTITPPHDGGHKHDQSAFNGDGTVLAIGMETMHNANVNDDDEGGVIVYEYNGTDWVQKGFTLLGPQQDAHFGETVALSEDGNILAVGIMQYTTSTYSNSGAIRVYEYKMYSSNDDSRNRYDYNSYDNANAKPLIVTEDTSTAPVVGNYYWSQIGVNIEPNESDNSYAGISLSMSGDGTKLIIGKNSEGAEVWQLGTPPTTTETVVSSYQTHASDVVDTSAPTVISQTFSEDISFNHSLVVPGNLVIVDGSNNTNYGSYTTYTSADLDNSVSTPTNKSYHVGKSKSNMFNIVNQDNIGVYMNTGDTSFTSTSDERLKHNIQHTEDSLEKICELQPRKFKWKYNDKSESGFIAQEIEKVFPEMVDENTLPDGKTIKGVNHSSLLPYILDSLQSLDKEIDDLIEE
jgi:hypothetical protein